jgi:hypothetical protein
MTLSNIQPVYPSGIFPWTDRIDNVNIDFANDINSTVADLEAVETVLGTNPQVELGLPGGVPVTYATVSARITDAMTGANLPYVSLVANSVPVTYNSAGVLCPFKASLDPYSCYNGTDITIPSDGWWSVSSVATWSWNNTGYFHHSCCLNGAADVLHDHIFDCQFSGNVVGLVYSPNGTPVQQSSQVPRFYQYGKRQMTTRTNFDGLLHAGDRISIYLENGTGHANITVPQVNLKAALIRTLPSTVTFVSG